MRRLGIAVAMTGCGVVMLALPACSRSPSAVVVPAEQPEPAADMGGGFFQDRTPGSGIDHTYRNGEESGQAAILESLGGGVGLIDYDRDGRLDIFLTGGGDFAGPNKTDIVGRPCKLYRNLGNWRFEDVTAKVGLAAGAPFYTHGAAVADADNDGWPDLLVTGWGRLALWHNEPDGQGGRRFVDVTQKAGLTDTLWSSSAAWADFDGDGFADLYVCHYVDWSWANNPPCLDYKDSKVRDVCPPRQFKGLPHTVYRNRGDGTFEDVSKTAGLRPDGKGLGVIVVDVDGDGKPDVYVANDTVENFLYLNRSSPGKVRFEEAGRRSGTALDDGGVPNGSMGLAAADYDGTGRFSLFVANYQHEAHALYRNRGAGQFVFASRSAGVTAIGLVYVGFGSWFVDYDRDGAEDIVVSNGHVVHVPPPPGEVKQLPVLFRNLRTPGQEPYQVRFANVAAEAGPYFRSKHCGRGLAAGDLDNDGRPDLVVSHQNEPAVVLQNVLDNGNHWLGVRLTGAPYRDAVGAVLTYEAGGQKLVRTVLGGGSYLSASDPRVLFGLGQNAGPGKLTVRWPSGREQVFDGLATDRYWDLTEGQMAAEEGKR
ncbi:MAG: CRTAC1 family protein [Gemmataceae bacterium]|nr:CRTAC1 family protein [Gemmataceae bacterium]